VNDTGINDLLKAFDNPHHCFPQHLVDAIRLLVKERNNARRDVLAHIAELKAKINILTAERDEARKEVCELKSYNFEGKISPKAYAEMRKWDCFKEDGK
jgi:hypothetical protein